MPNELAVAAGSDVLEVAGAVLGDRSGADALARFTEEFLGGGNIGNQSTKILNGEERALGRLSGSALRADDSNLVRLVEPKDLVDRGPLSSWETATWLREEGADPKDFNLTEEGAWVHNTATVGVAKLGAGSIIGPDVRIFDGAEIGPGVKIGSGTEIAPGVTIGEGSTIGRGNQFFPGVQIGERVETDSSVYVYEGAKVLNGARIGFVSNIYGTVGEGAQLGESTTVEAGAEIGAGATVIGKVGTGAWIDPHATVTTDVPPGSTVYASNLNGARSIGSRLKFWQR